MDVRITWVIPPDILITDEFDVLYKEADLQNLNNWIIANPSPLPSTANTYDIIGLNPNTVYRFAVTKSCIGTTSVLDEGSLYAASCPIIGVYQGPPSPTDRTNPTMFYSLYYPNSKHVEQTALNLFNLTTGNAGLICSLTTPTQKAPVNRTIYQDVDSCAVPADIGKVAFCNTDGLFSYPTNSKLTSSVGYYGLGTSSWVHSFNSSVCGAATGPIYLNTNNDFAFFFRPRVVDPNTISTPPLISSIGTGSSIDASCIGTNPSLYPKVSFVDILPQISRISGTLCWDSLTGAVNSTILDGTNQTNIGLYQFEYFTDDVTSSSQLPLVNSSGNLITSYNAAYTVYCPVEINPQINPAQLSANMTIVVTVNTPVPTQIVNATVDMTGFSYKLVSKQIQSVINQFSSYTADYVLINGIYYVRIYTPGTSFVSASVVVNGPSMPSPITYTGLTHSRLSINVNNTPYLVNDNVYATSLTADTFGQYKVQEALPLPGDDVVFWNSIPTSGIININPFETIEITQFSLTSFILEIENLNSAVLYQTTDPTYLDASTLPTYNTLNSILFFAIKADYINLNPGDQLRIVFNNIDNPSCPFERIITINF